MIVVSDTSSLNALYKIGQIALLPALFRQVLIPEQVYAEMMRDPYMKAWLEYYTEPSALSGDACLHGRR